LQQKKEQGISIACPALLPVVVQAARNVVGAEKNVKKVYFRSLIRMIILSNISFIFLKFVIERR